MPAGLGWYHARSRREADPAIEVVHVIRATGGGLEVEVAGQSRRFPPDAFDWLGPVAPPWFPAASDQPNARANSIGPLEAQLGELIEAMRAKGYQNPSIGIVLSAGVDGIAVGTYLHPDQGLTISMLDSGLTHRTLGWARHQVQRLPPTGGVRACPPAAD